MGGVRIIRLIPGLDDAGGSATGESQLRVDFFTGLPMSRAIGMVG